MPRNPPSDTVAWTRDRDYSQDWKSGASDFLESNRAEVAGLCKSGALRRDITKSNSGKSANVLGFVLDRMISYTSVKGMGLEILRNDEGSNALWKRRAYEGKPLYLGELQKSCGQKCSYKAGRVGLLPSR